MREKTEKLCPCCGRSMECFAFKGFSYDETLAKIGKVHRVGDMVINFKTLRFTKAGETVKLTKNEWKYLAVLMSQSGNPVSRETLYRLVVGLDGGTTRSIDTFIAMLRHHFGRHIETIHAMGYRWTDTPTEKVMADRVADRREPKPKAPRPVKAKRQKIEKPFKSLPIMVEDSKHAESPVRLYRIRGTHVQWDGKGTPPELISAYQRARGELPSFITLPAGEIKFTLAAAIEADVRGFSMAGRVADRREHVVVWSGKGPLPEEVLHHIDEHQALPPMVTMDRFTPRGKNRRAA